MIVAIGQQAAHAIHLCLTGREVTAPENLQTKRLPETDPGELEGIERLDRSPMPELEVAERIDNFLMVPI